jgi:hypothetical protein
VVGVQAPLGQQLLDVTVRRAKSIWSSLSGRPSKVATLPSETLFL